MATDPKRIELHLDADPCFAACLEAFELRPNSSHLIEFCRFEDRVEVVVDSNAGPAAIRLSRSVISQS